MTPAKQIDFRPMQGLMSIGQRIAAALGISQLWDGNNGLEGVIRQKLTEMGVPEHPVPLNGPQGMTVRQMAEKSGFIKRPRAQRRVKGK